MSPRRLVVEMRKTATRFGPDYSISWPLLESAASLELLLLNGIIVPSSSS